MSGVDYDTKVGPHGHMLRPLLGEPRRPTPLQPMLYFIPTSHTPRSPTPCSGCLIKQGFHRISPPERKVLSTEYDDLGGAGEFLGKCRAIHASA